MSYKGLAAHTSHATHTYLDPRALTQDMPEQARTCFWACGPLGQEELALIFSIPGLNYGESGLEQQRLKSRKPTLKLSRKICPDSERKGVGYE